MSYISSSLVNQVSTGISSTTTTEISAFHTSIRALLEPDYETFLQGSYANDTEIKDFNDVDIVALKKPIPLGFLPSIGSNTNLFLDVVQKLGGNQYYRGRISTGRKCLTISLDTRKADIVPAIQGLGKKNAFGEPIIIAQNIPNYPKTHISNGRSKNQRTSDSYKKVVRMLKNYVNNWNLKHLAPSFYVECLIYSYTDNNFSNDLPLSLNSILSHMVSRNFNINFRTVAGDKPVVSLYEWAPQEFSAFRNHVAGMQPFLAAAITAQNEANANSYFRQFYNL